MKHSNTSCQPRRPSKPDPDFVAGWYAGVEDLWRGVCAHCSITPSELNKITEYLGANASGRKALRKIWKETNG